MRATGRVRRQAAASALLSPCSEFCSAPVVFASLAHSAYRCRQCGGVNTYGGDEEEAGASPCRRVIWRRLPAPLHVAFVTREAVLSAAFRHASCCVGWMSRAHMLVEIELLSERREVRRRREWQCRDAAHAASHYYVASHGRLRFARTRRGFSLSPSVWSQHCPRTRCSGVDCRRS